jgi:hypothetical protein
VRRVGEKLEAIREAQLEALSTVWRASFMPSTVWGPLAGRSLPASMAAATEAVVAPFSRRAAGNATRLRARALRTARRRPFSRQSRKGSAATRAHSARTASFIARASCQRSDSS